MFRFTESVAQRFVFVAAAVGLLAGCAGSGGPSALTPGTSPQGDSSSAVHANKLAANGLPSARQARSGKRLGASSGWLSREAVTGSHIIYSGDYDNNTITIFPEKGTNPPPIGTISTGLSNPERLFVDRGLKLYATNIGNNTIVVYPPGATSPSLTISNGVDSPTGLVVGGDGTVYCANVGNDVVTVYHKGKTKPALTIPMGYASPENLAVDSANNLYVSYLGGSHGSGVMEFPPGKTTGKDLNLVVGDAGAIEVDRSGNIILVDGAVPSVDVFPAGQTNPSKVIPITDGSPFELSLNKLETKLFVSVEVGIPFAIEVTGYPGGSKFTDKITSNVGDWPLAVSPDNAL